MKKIILIAAVFISSQCFALTKMTCTVDYSGAKPNQPAASRIFSSFSIVVDRFSHAASYSLLNGKAGIIDVIAVTFDVVDLKFDIWIGANHFNGDAEIKGSSGLLTVSGVLGPSGQSFKDVNYQMSCTIL